MATTQLTDIIEPTVFMDLPSVDNPEKTALYESGIIVKNPLLDGIASGDGKNAELPFWNDLDPTVEPNISTDDPADVAVPGKIIQGEQIARRLFLNNGWSSADLVAEVAMGTEAIQQIRNRSDTYWRRQWQRRLIAAANGVLADNVANDSGDMAHDVAAEAIASQTAATRFSRTNFTSAAFTLGDRFDETGAIAMHSMIYKQAVDNDDIDFIPDSQGRLVIPTYMGKRVIVDDGMTVTPGSTDGFKYTTILFGAGSYGYGDGTPKVPVEVEREASQGEGGGIETLWTRKTWLIHPFGYQFTSTTVTGASPSLAEYRLAANWDRVVERKNVPVAYLITN